MKPSVEQIGNLLALKRDERPEEGYWQDFLCDFHQKQRERTVSKATFAGFMSWLSSSFSDLGPAKWAYGVGVAYASVAAVFLLNPRDPVRENLAPVPASYQVVPAPAPPVIEQLDQLDLSPETQGITGEQVF